MPDVAEIVSRVREVAIRVVAPRAADYDARAAWPEASMRELQREGLFGLVVPRTWGGLGEGLHGLVRVCEVLGHADPSVALCFGMHQVGAACMAARPASGIAERFLRPICEGRHITTLALSEPGTGSHFYLPAATIAREDGQLVVHGEKAFVTNAGHADSYVVSGLSADPKAPPGHFSMLVVPADARGLKLGPAWTGWGMRANTSRSLELEGVCVPPDHLLGSEGEQIWFVFHVVAPYFLIAMTGAYLGIASRAIDETVAHLRRREHSHTGRRLAEVELLQHRIGQMWARLERTRQLAYGAATAADRGAPDALPAILAAKAEVAGAAVSIVNDALTLGGGRAYRDDTVLTRLLRDVRAADVMSPTTDLLYTWIGRAALGLPLLGS